MAQVVGQVGPDGELAPDDPVGLGVAEALGRAWQPVLAREAGQLVDDGLDQLLLAGECALLGQLQLFICAAGVAQPLGHGEQARAKPAVKLGPVEELGPPLQPPQPQDHVVQGPQDEEGEAPLGVHGFPTFSQGVKALVIERMAGPSAGWWRSSTVTMVLSSIQSIPAWV